MLMTGVLCTVCSARVYFAVSECVWRLSDALRECLLRFSITVMKLNNFMANYLKRGITPILYLHTMYDIEYQKFKRTLHCI